MEDINKINYLKNIAHEINILEKTLSDKGLKELNKNEMIKIEQKTCGVCHWFDINYCQFKGEFVSPEYKSCIIFFDKSEAILSE